ncbi:MAG: hypothetical protein ACP5O4_02340 [bacterium]
MLYLILGNNYINFFNNENNFLIPVYYTVFKDQLVHFGSYSFLQYILFNQYLRNSYLSDTIILNDYQVKKIIINNVLNDEKIFFKIINSIFNRDKFFDTLYKIDLEYKQDYENYKIFYPDWNLLYQNLKFSQDLLFIKRFNFDNFQTKMIVDIFNYFNKKVKVIDSWKYYFNLYKYQMANNRSYLFFYFGYYNIEIFIVSFENLLYYLTNYHYDVSYRKLLNDLYCLLYNKGIFIKYLDLINLCNFFLKNIIYIINNPFDKQEINLISKDKEIFIEKKIYYHEFNSVLLEFYKDLRNMFIDIFTKVDLQIIEDIYEGHFKIISNYDIKDLFLGLLKDIMIDVRS